jgi:hypothetical protein
MFMFAVVVVGMHWMKDLFCRFLIDVRNDDDVRCTRWMTNYDESRLS